MRSVLAFVSDRSDRSPLTPVIAALKEQGLRVGVMDADGNPDVPGDFDLCLLLGDRMETGCAAMAATGSQMPIAHIHGGEASFGSFDNQIRDAITKLAHIHFVVAEPMRERLLALGEEPWRIHVVGAPGLDNLVNLPPRRPEKYFVVTYHPATLVRDDGTWALIQALERFPDYTVMWTGTNNDPGAAEVHSLFVGNGFEEVHFDPRQYLEAARHAAAIVGNSSSGIIEAPTLEVPAVNVGPRQDGRLKGPSIIDCRAEASSIEYAIRCALEYDGPFTNPYGGPGASKKIADVLSTIDLDGIMVKRWAIRRKWYS